MRSLRASLRLNSTRHRERFAGAGPPAGSPPALPGIPLGQPGSAILITLEVGQYWTRQVSWRGDKQVELGTGYVQDVPWLTSLDAPVQVLQLTGVRIDRDGLAIRIGAEGLLARRTNLVLSGFGVQSLLSEDDVARVRTMRREDLPGAPLVWQVALRTLVGELSGAPLSDR